ncbi:MAG: hypothetical protein L0Z48_06830 [candidate division Zixibacteria bacterium]|nr:hypothetical protein [candidate division Zixibacteria bacterium]
MFWLRKSSWPALVLLCFSAAQASFERTGQSPASSALGGAYFNPEPEAVFYNPSLLGLLSEHEVGFCHQRLFGLDELSSNQLAAVFKAHNVYFGIGFYSFGRSDYYLENGFWLSAAFPVSRFTLGGSVKGLLVSYGGNYSSDQTAAADLSILTEVRRIRFGAVIQNIPFAPNQSNSILPPAVLAVGASAQATEKVDLFVGGVTQKEGREGLNFGQEYRPAPYLALRAGFRTAPARYSFGFGALYKLFQFDYSYTSHPELGGENSFGVRVKW